MCAKSSEESEKNPMKKEYRREGKREAEVW